MLLFDGEELVGARQDRIVNTSILVPGARSIDIPVSCVERGRWRYRTARFAAGSVLTHEMRRSKVMRVTMNLRRTGTYDADQGAVWEEVAEYAERRGARSATGAYADVVAKDRARIEEHVAALPCASGQAGLAAYIGGELIGADVLGSAALYAALHARLVGALAAEAIDRPARGEGKRQVSLAMALAQAVRGKALASKPPGLGTDVRLETARYTASALVHEGHVVHLALFARPAG